MEVNLDED
jgi:hypothetical protein